MGTKFTEIGRINNKHANIFLFKHLILIILTTFMRRPGYAPGHPAWKADMLLSHPRRSIYITKKKGMKRTTRILCLD